MKKYLIKRKYVLPSQALMLSRGRELGRINGLALLLCWVPRLLWATPVDVLPNLKSLRSSSSILTMNIGNSDYQSGRLVIQLSNEADRIRISPGEIPRVSLNSLKNSSFSNFYPWAQSLAKISNIKEYPAFFNTCPALMTQYSLENSTSYDRTLNRKLSRQCIITYLGLPIKSVTSNKDLENGILSFFMSHLKEIGSKKLSTHLRNFLVRLKGRPDLMEKLTNSLSTRLPLDKGKINISPNAYGLLQKLMASTSDLNRLGPYRPALDELKAMSRGLKNELNKEGQGKENMEVIRLALDFIHVYQSSAKNLDREEARCLLLSLGKQLLYSRYDNLSRKIFSLALESSDSGQDFYESLFYVMWTHLKNYEYTASSNLITNYNLLENFGLLPSNLQFWVAYTLEKVNSKELALKYYENIILQNPLSFYSIIASKKLAQLGDPQRSFSELFFGKTNILKTPPNKILTDSKLYSDFFLKSLTRLSIFAKLRDDTLLSMESNSLIGMDKDLAYADGKMAATIDEKDFLGQKILLTAKILTKASSYLKSFSVVQRALEENHIPVHKDLLLTLFPYPYFVQIKNIEKEIDPVIILSLIRQESAFNPQARSSAGATGLMQLMLPTAKRMKRSIRSAQLRNPITNLKVGISFFKQLLKKYNGNLVYALAAYNAGERNLEKWIKNVFISDSILFTIESIPFQETKMYVKLIFRNIFFYKFLVDGPKDSMHLNKIFDISLGPDQHD